MQTALVFVPAIRSGIERQIGPGQCSPPRFQICSDLQRLGQRIGREPQAAMESLARIHINLYGQHIAMGVDANAIDKGVILHTQANVSQKSVPVGLGVVSGGRGIQNGIVGHALIGVVGIHLQQVIAGQQPSKLEDMRGIQGLRPIWLNQAFTDPDLQATSALHLEEDPLPRLRGPSNLPGQSDCPLEGVPPGQPGADGSGLAAAIVSRQLLIIMSESVGVQCARQQDGSLQLRRGLNLPGSSQCNLGHACLPVRIAL